MVKDKIANEVQKLDDAVSIARKKIEREITSTGPYSHNIVALVLRDLATNWGLKYANQLVRELELDSYFGIDEVEE